MAKPFQGSQLLSATPNAPSTPWLSAGTDIPAHLGCSAWGESSESLHAASWCGLIYNLKRAHLVTSLSGEKQQPVCAIFSLAGLFWASLLLFLQLKPQTSSSQREKQCCLRWVHRNVFRAGKEPTGVSWHIPKHQLGRQDLQQVTWSSRPHVFGQAEVVLVYDGDNTRLGTEDTVPHTLSSCLRQALVINYCHIISNRGGLLESPVNQGWNYRCGFAISWSPAERLAQLLLEIPILKPLLQLPHEGSSICSCTPGRSTALQAGRGSFPLMTAICRFL